ncbi:MAG: hydrogenase formation protein HypD [Candidatus Omnitrophica bacterium]|nr:hydrogenase formation protein HypD [Candidatus Omnitrophota bacterium]
MRYIDEYRNKGLIQAIAERIKMSLPGYPIKIMEVCGTHTHNFYRFGLDKLIPPNLKLISGPGCPVCVSTQDYIDSCINLAGYKDVILTTFGDMLAVPGSNSSLEKARARLGNIQVIYSPLDSLAIAQNNPGKKIVFLAVGFETTAPGIAITILKAKREKIRNFFIFSSLKLMPPTMEFLLKDKQLHLHGFLCPGHVSAIIGINAYLPLSRKYKICCCVAGFEPVDILDGIYLILRQIAEKRTGVENQYSRVVTAAGNRKAQSIIRQVFEVEDACWRGLGVIPASGLRIKREFSGFDARVNFSLNLDHGSESRLAAARVKSANLQKRCRCDDVLRGIIQPDQCSLFKKICTPDQPYGPCMVSIEGACHAYYKYL